MPVFKAAALKIGSTWIGGISQQTATNEANVQSTPVAGSAYPLQLNINSIKDSFSFQTFNVAAALTALGSLGADLNTNAAELFEIQWTDAGQIAAGTAHRKMVFAQGRAVPRRLTCRNGEDASLEIMIMGISPDGATNPLVITEGVALPAPLDDARHTLHSGTFATIGLGCLENVDIDFGIAIESKNCSSDIFDSRIEISSIVPKISVTTLKADLIGNGVSQIPNIGRSGTHINSNFKFRKRTPRVASFVPNATEEHILITVDGTAVPSTMFQSSNNDDGTAVIEITSRFDGTNVPLVIDTTAALT
jgi:hypothetical protein